MADPDENPVAYIAGFLSALVVLILAAARLRYRSYRRAVLVRQARLHRAEKLLAALSGTLRATANPDAAPATSLDPESDTLVRERTAARGDRPNLRRARVHLRPRDVSYTAPRVSFRCLRPQSADTPSVP
jgi:hypothetical protein